MQSKPFVALSFSPLKLQIIKLNSGKTRVEKFATVDLPQGLIVNYQVVNPAGLAEVIKNVWRQVGLREKTVGLTIPEFSSFVKPISLPKINISDLDEAVRWQAQEFLPTASSDMVMDWKIVGETADKYSILTVAMKKAILAGYVDAVEAAGLFPLLVKTPALTLTNLTMGEPLGKLIIYSNLGEIILVVAAGQKILGSSVVGGEEKVRVSTIAASIVRHYKEIEIKKIFIGGIDATQSLASEVSKVLGKPAEILKVNVGGVPSDQIQKYLIPVSLGMTKSVGPSDETTINLLPSKWVKRYENKRLKSQIWGLLTLSTLVMLGCLVFTGGTYFYLRSQVKVFARQIESGAQGAPKELTGKVEEINKTANTILAISEVAKTPQEVMNAILKVKPAEVSVVDYKLDLDTGKISFGGVAATREALVKFKDGLEENKDFGAVSIPISSFEAEVNLDYQISFTFLPASKKVGKTPKIPQKSQ